MIVIGYQGIGKSTLAKNSYLFLDLESSTFWIDGKKSDDWYIPYCQMAEYLSRQGYVVFTSSHKPVRDFLKNSNEKVIAVCPTIELKEEWLKRLQARYESSQSFKDLRAWTNAIACYEENIKDIANDYETVFIDTMDYNLNQVIFRAENGIKIKKVRGHEQNMKIGEVATVIMEHGLYYYVRSEDGRRHAVSANDVEILK